MKLLFKEFLISHLQSSIIEINFTKKETCWKLLRAPTFLQDRGQGRDWVLNRVQCCGNSTCNRKLWFPENEVLTFHNINISTSIIYNLLEDLIYCCLVLGLCFKHLPFSWYELKSLSHFDLNPPDMNHFSPVEASVSRGGERLRHFRHKTDKAKYFYDAVLFLQVCLLFINYDTSYIPLDVFSAVWQFQHIENGLGSV